MGKGEIAHYEQFLLFQNRYLSCSSNLKKSSANSFSVDDPKICHLGKGEECVLYQDSDLFKQ